MGNGEIQCIIISDIDNFGLVVGLVVNVFLLQILCKEVGIRRVIANSLGIKVLGADQYLLVSVGKITGGEAFMLFTGPGVFLAVGMQNK